MTEVVFLRKNNLTILPNLTHRVIASDHNRGHYFCPARDHVHTLGGDLAGFHQYQSNSKSERNDETGRTTLLNTRPSESWGGQTLLFGDADKMKKPAIQPKLTPQQLVHESMKAVQTHANLKQA
jgi:hypothetical protein